VKVVVINFCGNVGKTTISGQLLKPRMNNAPIFSVESLNVDATSDGIQVERFKGKKFGELIDGIMLAKDAIIDVGASNVEEFIKFMQQYDSSHEEFDYFLIPVLKERKVQVDTVNTIRALSALGIPRSKIRVVFNKVDADESLKEEFSILFDLSHKEDSFTLVPEAIIHSNEVFEKLKVLGKSLGEINSDETNYRAQLREASTEADQNRLLRLIAIKRLAVTANRNFDEAFNALFN